MAQYSKRRFHSHSTHHALISHHASRKCSDSRKHSSCQKVGQEVKLLDFSPIGTFPYLWEVVKSGSSTVILREAVKV